jgi:hypothetical protein
LFFKRKIITSEDLKPLEKNFIFKFFGFCISLFGEKEQQQQHPVHLALGFLLNFFFWLKKNSE